MFQAHALHDEVNRARPLFPEINQLYQRLPQTRCCCEGPGECCLFLPEMTFVEAMQWMDMLLGMEARQRTQFQKKSSGFISLRRFAGWDTRRL